MAKGVGTRRGLLAQHAVHGRSTAGHNSAPRGHGLRGGFRGAGCGGGHAVFCSKPMATRAPFGELEALWMPEGARRESAISIRSYFHGGSIVIVDAWAKAWALRLATSYEAFDEVKHSEVVPRQKASKVCRGLPQLELVHNTGAVVLHPST